VAVAAAMWMNIGCGNRSNPEATEFPFDDGITTRVPVDPGRVHNEILEAMDAASIPTGSLTRREYLRRVVAATNDVLSRYGASRALTVDDCKVILDIGAVVTPLYDFQFRDPARADPMRPIRYWYEHGLLDTHEFVQLEQLFAEPMAEKSKAVAAAIASRPASETVAAGVSVYQRSMNYWGRHTSPPPSDERGPMVPGEDDDKAGDLRKGWADALGGIIGHILVGPLGGALIGIGTSTLFIIETACWPEPCHGDGPPPAPCGGYTGVGPCPD
jgi:hypothetical protein